MNDRYGNGIGTLCKVCGDRASGIEYKFRRIFEMRNLKSLQKESTTESQAVTVVEDSSRGASDG